MRLSTCRIMSLALLGLSLFAAPAHGQRPETIAEFRWELGPALPSWCVHFLMDPKEAGKELPGEMKPVPASFVSELHPALKRAIADEPKFSEWIPADLCVYYVQSISFDAKKYEKGDKNTSLAMAYLGISATEGEATWDGRYRLRVLGSNSYNLVRATQVKGIQMDQIKIDADPIPGSEEDMLYVIRLNGATVQFTGHFNPDSTGAAPAEQRMVGLTPGPIQSVWTTTFSYTPASFGTMAGSLQIIGKRGLAKALNSSPIRLIGQAISGGSGTLEGSRTSTRKR